MLKINLKDFDTCLRVMYILDNFPGLHIQGRSLIKIAKPELNERGFDNRFSLFSKLGILEGKQGQSGGYVLNSLVKVWTAASVYHALEPYLLSNHIIFAKLVYEWSNIRATHVYKDTSEGDNMRQEFIRLHPMYKLRMLEEAKNV